VASLVGIDVGTTGVKAIALSPDGDIQGRAERGYGLDTPRPGWAEQDPAAWWDATEAALAELEVKSLAGIGLSGQMHGLVVLDKDLEVLRPAILWNDQRTAAECAQIEDRLGFERVVELTGNRALTGFTAPKLLWLRNHEPDIYERVAHVLLPKDYVRLRLTGELAGDVSDASGTLLFDVGERRWSKEILDALDMDPAWLPAVLESPEVSGRSSAGVPVAAGAGDQAAGAVGVGVDRAGTMSVALGTSGVVFAPLPGYRTDPLARLHVFCHALPEAWHAMGVMLSAGGSLRWLRDLLEPGASYDSLLAEAQRWEPGAEGLTFLPYLAGERTPHADPDARGSFSGLSLRHDRGALVRAVVEGVAFGLRDGLELLRSLGAGSDVARVSGGGSRSKLWLQIVASIMGISLELTAVEEGAAYGAALLGGVAGGAFSSVSEAIDACVSVRGVVEPDPSWIAPYDDAYRRFRALYPALKSVEST
jgi:xylulokinase